MLPVARSTMSNFSPTRDEHLVAVWRKPPDVAAKIRQEHLHVFSRGIRFRTDHSQNFPFQPAPTNLESCSAVALRPATHRPEANKICQSSYSDLAPEVDPDKSRGVPGARGGRASLRGRMVSIVANISLPSCVKVGNRSRGRNRQRYAVIGPQSRRERYEPRRLRLRAGIVGGGVTIFLPPEEHPAISHGCG